MLRYTRRSFHFDGKRQQVIIIQQKDQAKSAGERKKRLYVRRAPKRVAI